MENSKAVHSASEKVLWIVLSALGVMALAVVAGILLFYKPAQSERARFTSAPIETTGSGGSAVSDDPAGVTVDAAPEGEEPLDTVNWARENGDVPALELPTDGSEVTDENGDILITWDPAGKGEKAPVQIRTEKKPVVTETRKAPVTDTVKVEPVKAPTRREEAIVWWIQVASFSSSYKAETMSESLYMKGIPTSIQTQVVGGKTWYRIRVGAFSSREEADSFQQKLQNLPEIDSPLIVKGTIVREVPAN